MARKRVTGTVRGDRGTASRIGVSVDLRAELPNGRHVHLRVGASGEWILWAGTALATEPIVRGHAGYPRETERLYDVVPPIEGRMMNDRDRPGYVNLPSAVPEDDQQVQYLPRHSTYGAAHDAQTHEGAPWQGAWTILYVSANGDSEGVVTR